MRLSLGRGAGARPSAARHRGGAWSAAALPSAPLLPLNLVGPNTELCKKRVCELEEKQWRTDRDESGSESMTEYVAPAPAVYYATPAPPIEFVTPSPVIEYSAPAPPVTCFTPSPQFPTMADLITGVTTSVDDACPRSRSCTEHLDLTADDSQDECLADGMPSYEMAS